MGVIILMSTVYPLSPQLGKKKPCQVNNIILLARRRRLTFLRNADLQDILSDASDETPPGKL